MVRVTGTAALGAALLIAVAHAHADDCQAQPTCGESAQTAQVYPVTTGSLPLPASQWERDLAAIETAFRRTLPDLEAITDPGG